MSTEKSMQSSQTHWSKKRVITEHKNFGGEFFFHRESFSVTLYNQFMCDGRDDVQFNVLK